MWSVRWRSKRRVSGLEHERGAVRSTVRPKSSPVGREHSTELQCVGHDHQRRIGVIHRDVEIAGHEANGVLVPRGLQGDDRYPDGEQELQGQRGCGAASRDEVTCLGDDRFSR